MKTIQLIIIGAQKAGTSSLKQYLSQHPGILTHQKPEMTYFLNDDEFSKGYERAFQRHFYGVQPSDIILLAKNAGIMYSLTALKRLRDHNPDAKLVISLRNPVDRAYSAYWHARRMGWEDLDTFEAAIKANPLRFKDDWIKNNNCAYLDRSTYVKHISNIFNTFMCDQIHILTTDDLKQNAINACHNIFNLIDGLDPEFTVNVGQRHNVAALPRFRTLAKMISSKDSIPHIKLFVRRLLPNQIIDEMKVTIRRLNERSFSPPPIKVETKEKLIDYFKPYNVQLSELIRRDLSIWNTE